MLDKNKEFPLTDVLEHVRRTRTVGYCTRSDGPPDPTPPPDLTPAPNEPPVQEEEDRMESLLVAAFQRDLNLGRLIVGMTGPRHENLNSYLQGITPRDIQPQRLQTLIMAPQSLEERIVNYAIRRSKIPQNICMVFPASELTNCMDVNQGNIMSVAHDAHDTDRESVEASGSRQDPVESMEGIEHTDEHIMFIPRQTTQPPSNEDGDSGIDTLSAP